MTRTTTEIQNEINQVVKAQANYNNVANEGCKGQTPYESKLADLHKELYQAKQVEIAAKLSGESLQAERAWFNSQGFKRPDLAQKACQDRGYNMSDLFAAIKALA
jgi:hypothetical protein